VPDQKHPLLIWWSVIGGVATVLAAALGTGVAQYLSFRDRLGQHDTRLGVIEDRIKNDEDRVRQAVRSELETARKSLAEEAAQRIAAIQAAKPAATPATVFVLEPTWIERGKSVSILERQVMLRLDRGNHIDVDLAVNLNQEWKPLPGIPIGDRAAFAYRGVDYYVEVQENEGGRVKIAVVPRKAAN
jgi:hypothetical protein